MMSILEEPRRERTGSRPSGREGGAQDPEIIGTDDESLEGLQLHVESIVKSAITFALQNIGVRENGKEQLRMLERKLGHGTGGNLNRALWMLFGRAYADAYTAQVYRSGVEKMGSATIDYHAIGNGVAIVLDHLIECAGSVDDILKELGIGKWH